MGWCAPFDITQSWLNGVPAATMQGWLAQCQIARFQMAIGSKPVTLAYTQGDGSKSVTMQITSPQALEQTIALLNMALGNATRVRAPIRPYMR